MRILGMRYCGCILLVVSRKIGFRENTMLFFSMSGALGTTSKSPRKNPTHELCQSLIRPVEDNLA
jgi:hypothetical protein